MEDRGVYKPADDFTPSEGMLERGMALQKVQTQYTTAIAVQRPRDIDKIQKAVLREAEYAGEDFYYSWTVSSKDGPKTIQGPSIGLTMSLAREWTNCAVDVNVEVAGAYDIFTASFVDIEKGFTVKRAFKQKRSSAPGRYDADRWEDMEFQKAQSKAIRNVIASGVPRWLVNQAVERAKDSVLKNISKEGIEAASNSAIKFLGQYGISIERIIERVGKPKNEWSTEDIAMLRGCASELKDGQASAETLFPSKKEPAKTLEPNGKKVEPGKNIYAIKEEDKVIEKDTNGDDDKPLFERLKAARSGYYQMVLDNNDEIGTWYEADPSKYEYLKEKWIRTVKDKEWPFEETPTDLPNQEQGQQTEDGESIPMPDLSNGKNGSDFHAWLDDVKGIVGPAKYAQGLREVGIESITKITPLQQTKAREWFNRAVDEME